MSFLENLGMLHWWLLGVTLLVLEVFVPQGVLLVAGLCAGATGLLTLVAPALPWEHQALLFGLLGVAGLTVWYGHRRRAARPPG